MEISSTRFFQLNTLGILMKASTTRSLHLAYLVSLFNAMWYKLPEVIG